jgi:(p)ppGpp synthase/HD superfamily hydrolase
MKIVTLLAAALLAASPLVASAPCDHPAVSEQFEWLSHEWLDYESTREWKSEVLFDAVLFAAERHEGQVRKGDQVPYITHPLRVARILWEEWGIRSVNVLAAAILHDTVEDTETTLEELADRFGPRIATTVGEVSDDQSLPAEEKKRLQIIHAPTMSHDAQLVKMADRIDNLRDMATTSWSEEKKATYRYWGRELAAGVKGAHPELERALTEVAAP